MFVCRHTTELASDHLEGGLTGVTRLRFRMHLLICGNCRRYLAQMRATLRLLAFPPADEPLPGEDALVAAFHRQWPKTS